MESIVRRELEALGFQAKAEGAGRVRFSGGWEAIARTNLWLRSADRILIEVKQFPANDFDELFETTRSLPWGSLIPVDGKFPVTGRSIKSTLSSVPAIQRSVKRAIVDALQRDHNGNALEETGASYKVDVALLNNVATLTIDTTGQSLHKRGYRTDISKAPLKETLAAALVQLSYWKPGRMLLDPFCGSGTIPIEAALMGRNIAPGINREFAFQTWSDDCQSVLSDSRSDAIAGQLPELELRIAGSDRDFRVLRAARDNAQRAGVASDIHFEESDFSDVSNRKRFGCLITNPPYGRRIGGREDEGQSRSTQSRQTQSRSDQASAGGRDRMRPHSPELDALYQELPRVFRRLPTWSHYVFTAYPRFEPLVGRPADRRRKLYNGRIECTYYQFHGPKPVVEQRTSTSSNTTDDDGDDVSGEQGRRSEEKLQAGQTLVHASGTAAFGGLSPKSKEQAELFAARLRKRARHLRRWPTKRDVTCFRIYERDVPEIPLVVDRYENHLHITEYERPHERTADEHDSWLELMTQTASTVLEVPEKNVHLKSRQRQRGKQQHQKVEQSGELVEVAEGGLTFLINLRDYVDTGLFLDHRQTRSMVRDEAKGKRFLNLFAYTGSFSVYAADGAAASTTTVDLSKSYLDWAWQNMRRNGFDGNQHRFVVSDIREFIDKHPPGPAYDLVVLDPPTFSNSKRTENDWDVSRDAVPLINNLLPLISDGGVIYFSTNFRRFKWDESQIQATEVHEISRQTVPEDYRNRRIHRCWRMVK